MSFRTSVSSQGNITILEFQGQLNFEAQQDLRDQYAELIVKHENVVIDLSLLEFVGSSGVTNFIQTLRDLAAEKGRQPRFCNVPSEFKRLLEAFRIDATTIFESRSDALKDFFRDGKGESN